MENVTFNLIGMAVYVGTADLSEGGLVITTTDSFSYGITTTIESEEEFWAFAQSLPGYTEIPAGEVGSVHWPDLLRAIVPEEPQNGIAMIDLRVEQSGSGLRATMRLWDTADPATAMPADVASDCTVSFVRPTPIPLFAPCPYGVTHWASPSQAPASREELDAVNDAVSELAEAKQDRLIAGDGITISETGVISAAVADGFKVAGSTAERAACWNGTVALKDVLVIARAANEADHLYAYAYVPKGMDAAKITTDTTFVKVDSSYFTLVNYRLLMSRLISGHPAWAMTLALYTLSTATWDMRTTMMTDMQFKDSVASFNEYTLSAALVLYKD